MRPLCVFAAALLLSPSVFAQPAPPAPPPPVAPATAAPAPEEPKPAADQPAAPAPAAPAAAPTADGDDESSPGEDALVEAAPRAALAAPAQDEAGPKSEGYLIAGGVTLAAGVLSVAGGAWAAADESPQTAIGLTALGTALLGVGVPFVLLGGASEEPEDSKLVVAGTAIATPGVIAAGIGAVVMAKREAADKPNDDGIPYILMGAGAAAVVAGVITWAFGAGDEQQQDRTVSLSIGPGSAQLAATF